MPNKKCFKNFLAGFYAAALLVLLALVTAGGILVYTSENLCYKDLNSAAGLYSNSAQNEISEVLKPGDIGEADLNSGNRNSIASNIGLPAVIFNTSGTIAEIGKDYLIVNGSGSNFLDGAARKLTAIFTSETKVSVLGQKEKYQGLEGLKHLKVGDNILIGGGENIRGKEEFRAKTVNIFP